jgi:hypothetical protein
VCVGVGLCCGAGDADLLLDLLPNIPPELLLLLPPELLPLAIFNININKHYIYYIKNYDYNIDLI